MSLPKPMLWSRKDGLDDLDCLLSNIELYPSVTSSIIGLIFIDYVSEFGEGIPREIKTMTIHNYTDIVEKLRLISNQIECLQVTYRKTKFPSKKPKQIKSGLLINA